MIKFIISAFNKTSNKIKWRITIYNLIYSILNIGWLLQLHFLIQNFDIDELNSTIRIISTSITFLFFIFFSYYQARKDISDVSKISLTMGLELWDKFSHLEYPEFKRQERNTLVDMFMVNFWRIRNGYQTLFVNVISAIFTTLLLVAFLIYIDSLIAIIFIGFYAVFMLAQLSIHRQLSKSTNQFHQVWREQSNNVGKWADQYELIKLGRGKKSATNEFKNRLEYFLQTGDQFNINRVKQSGLHSFMLQSSRLGTLAIGYFLYKENIIDLPVILSAVIVLGWLNSQLSKIQSAIPVLIEAADSYNFYQEFLSKNSSKDINKHEVSENIEPIREIELKNISFQYESGKRVFENFSLKLEYGKVYLIKGNNGCGKTTMAKILLGLLTDYCGTIKINKQQIKKNIPDALKYRMSYLHQDFSLFYGSIKENYHFGLEETTFHYSEILKTLLPEFTDENEHIGEKGEMLSGGEKQRLALIREWGKSSDLYILDEPLNHLDKRSSDWLKDSIIEKKKSAIIVIISHQSGFESLADEIKYIEDGRIIESIPTTAC